MPRVMIRVEGELTEGLLSAFPQFVSSVRRSQTTLTGQIVDQAELQGVLNYLSSVGIAMTDVMTIPE